MASTQSTSNERQIDSMIDIVTPENISFRYQVAGPFRRFSAFVIDFVLRAAVIFALWFVILIFGAPFGGGYFAATVVIVTLFVSEWFYGGLLETYWNGQTVGKRMMSIRVLSTNGQPIDGMQGIMRNILRLPDIWPVVYLQFDNETPFFMATGLIGLIVPLLNSRYQRLGDLVCGTMVVVEEKGWLAGIVSLEDPRVPLLAAEIPPNFVIDRETAQAVAAYAERRRHLSTARRHEIAAHLAKPLLPRFRLLPDTSYDLLLCAIYYKAFVADQTTEDLPWTLEPNRQAPVATASVSTG